MNAKLRDPRFSTPESLAAADEWNAAREHMEGLAERIRKYGLSSVSAEDLAAARTRCDNAVRNLPIPPELLTYNSADWPGVEAAVFTTNSVHKNRQWNEARLNWCTAHSIWSAFFDELAEEKRNIQQKGKGHARTRRTSK